MAKKHIRYSICAVVFVLCGFHYSKAFGHGWDFDTIQLWGLYTCGCVFVINDLYEDFKDHHGVIFAGILLALGSLGAISYFSLSDDFSRTSDRLSYLNGAMDRACRDDRGSAACKAFSHARIYAPLSRSFSIGSGDY